MGGIIYGYHIGITGGVTLMVPFLKNFFPEVYKKMEGGANTSNYYKFNSQLLTSFTSSLYLAGPVASCFASSGTRSYDRKSSMLIGGAVVNVYMIILERILLGIGVGFANQVLYDAFEVDT